MSITFLNIIESPKDIFQALVNRVKQNRLNCNFTQ